MFKIIKNNKKKLLNEENYYNKLNYGPRQEQIQVINNIVKKFQLQHVLPKLFLTAQKQAKVRVLNFHRTPKIHIKDTPKRPVVMKVIFSNLLISAYSHMPKLYHPTFNTQSIS